MPGVRCRYGVITAVAVLAAGCATGGLSARGPNAGSPPAPTQPAETRSAMARTTPSPTPEPRSITVVATGDVLPHDELWTQARRDARPPRAYDFRPLFASARPAVRSADLAICHMETPLAPPGGPYQGYPTFASPPQIADALAWLGYDACSTASNHTLDQGFDGAVRTLETLRGTGIVPYGSARSAAQARRPDIVEVEGVRVGLLSYTFSLNGISEPEGKPWVTDAIDPDEILADARAARRAGAQLGVVSLHWGNEYQHEITEGQRDIAARLLASPDIDLLIGHHAHVVQPIERIDGEWVAYGLGNHVAAHETPVPANHEGMLARFTFTQRRGAWTVTRAEYLPTFVSDAYPVRLLDVAAELSSTGAAPASRERLEKALRRTTRVATSRGGVQDGLTRIEPR